MSATLTRRELLFTAGSFLAAQERAGAHSPVGPREKLRITKLELTRVKPRWTFLKVHTDAGVVGLGEPIVESRGRTVMEAVRELV